MATATATQTAAGAPLVDTGGADAIPNSYIVVYRDTAAALPELTNALAARYQATVTHTYAAALRGFAAQLSETRARLLAADPAVAYVSQDHRVRLAATQPNPPSWGLDRVDQRNRPLNNAYTYSTTASNVHVYVIDTGIRITHNDFGGRASWGVNTVDGTNTDCNGHGTHVAGTIGGAAHGVAKAARLHAVKVLDCTGNGSASTIIAGVDWVTAHRVRPAVANMSLGARSGITALDSAVRNSINSGVTYTISSGNDGRSDRPCQWSPQRVAEALTVNASTSTDARASFSNYGGCTDLFAPGQGITSAWNTSNTATNTISGTSMAAPHVAGAAALYLATHTSASPPQVRNHVVFNGTVGRISGAGSGSRNVLAHTVVTPPRAGSNALHEGGSLRSNQFIGSNVGNHELVMQNSDGNLVQYQAGFPLWSSGTTGNPGARAVLQHDGNFVIYTSGGRAIWSTRTSGTAANLLRMQDDGNIVLYGPGSQVFWHK